MRVINFNRRTRSQIGEVVYNTQIVGSILRVVRPLHNKHILQCQINVISIWRSRKDAKVLLKGADGENLSRRLTSIRSGTYSDSMPEDDDNDERSSLSLSTSPAVGICCVEDIRLDFLRVLGAGTMILSFLIWDEPLTASAMGASFLFFGTADAFMVRDVKPRAVAIRSSKKSRSNSMHLRRMQGASNCPSWYLL